MIALLAALALAGDPDGTPIELTAVFGDDVPRWAEECTALELPAPPPGRFLRCDDTVVSTTVSDDLPDVAGVVDLMKANLADRGHKAIVASGPIEIDDETLEVRVLVESTGNVTMVIVDPTPRRTLFTCAGPGPTPKRNRWCSRAARDVLAAE